MFMNYLLEDAVDFFDDFVAVVSGDLAPDFFGRRRHASFSFTKASRSPTDWVVSLERTVDLGKSAKLVQVRGKRRLTSPR
jgi:hypothetical protein